MQDGTEAMILGWLSSLQPNRKHRDVINRRLEGTGSWLLQDPLFKSWRDDPQSSQVLWCHGIPGAGRTIVSSLAIDSLRNPLSGEAAEIAFVYYDYQDQTQQTPVNVVGSILEQLASNSSSLPRSMTDLWEKSDKWRELPKLEDMGDIVAHICKGVSKGCLVIDALDECAAEFQKTLIEFLVLSATTRLFVTS